ncbi:MAG: protein kinase [Alphaproteobacteria bacterium]|nr:protein kinase [Alphaproteobacteria bacterium]
MSIRLGPFRLVRPIARGGMGRVWRADHATQGTPVAIKVLHGHVVKDERFLEGFRQEIRAVAALDHPGIVMVLDHGTVQPDEAFEDIVAGSPWLAMELASGGTLSHLTGALPWPGLKAILLAVLESLAHAHARNVIHRDLKPSNILVANPRDLRPGLKLSDFGIAHALDTEHTGPMEEAIMGTPMFMAPEQVRGQWRDHGPWTDLYALGCVAYVLASGKTPFASKRPGHAIMIDHLTAQPRPLDPVHELPEGFQAWLSTLMRKDRFLRFQSAADAAAALLALGDPATAAFPEDFETDPAAEAALDATKISLGETWRNALEAPAPAPVSFADGEVPRAAPIPASWRRALPDPPSMQLVGAGLSLYGLRSIPMVGRQSERDRLWSALREVHATGEARLVVLRGAAGTGKSRLARWLCERASETGAAHVTEAHFGPELQPGSAIRELGMRYLRTHDLDRDEVAERVADWVRSAGGSDDEALALTELMSPAAANEVVANVVRLTRPSEYHAAVARVFRRLATDRPVITWLDDVQWGFHGLGLARHILAAQSSEPFAQLLVATVRDEALADRPDESRRLAQLLEHPATTVIECGPLPPADHERLIRELLPLDDAILRQIGERTAGNPLFAVQLVGDWVQRGALEPGPDGFRLKPEAVPTLPDDLHAVWSSRLERILAEFDDEARTALEMAAALGQDVVAAEWHQAVDDPQGFFGDRFPGGRRMRQRLVERLLSERLAVGSPERWSFVHSMLKEALERSAREAGRWEGHNLAAATMLMARNPDRLTMPAERLGRHLLQAGQVETAIAPLLGGVEQRLVTMGAGAALSLLDTTTRAMLGVGLPETDKRWARVWTLTARIHLELGAPEVAERFHRRVIEASRANGWRGAELHAMVGEVRRFLMLGEHPRAAATLGELLDRAVAAKDARVQGLAHLGLGRLHRMEGEPDQALLELQTAIPLLARDPVEQANARLELARARDAAGHDAHAEYELALRALSDLGLGRLVADANVELGALLAARGQHEPAALHFEAAATRYDTLGAALEAGSARIRLMRSQLANGDGELALAAFRPSLSHLDHHARIGATLALNALAAALGGDWKAVSRAASGRADTGHTWARSLRDLAASVCAKAGEDGLADELRA